MQIKILEDYESQLSDILFRFKRTHDGINIAKGDSSKFRQICFELGDFFMDEIRDGNKYYQQIISDYNESISNLLNSPSYGGVDKIKVLVNSIISRAKRNPSIFVKSKKMNFLAEGKNDSFILLLLYNFHNLVLQLQQRHSNRPTLDVNDEYDVQDLFHVLLRIYYKDIRPEEWCPSYAGGSKRADFYLSEIETIIEIKKSRESLNAKKLGEELIIDIENYKKHLGCKKVICFCYDPDRRIINPSGIEHDLSRSEDNFDVQVIIEPK